jgi:subtilase family serine protease
VSAGRRLDLVLPLVADGAGLARFARAVSDPGSPLYGRYSPVAALSRRFGATPATRFRVERYLRLRGARGVRIDATGQFADATMRAGDAERVFATALAVSSLPDGERYVAPRGRVRASSAAALVPPGLRGLATAVLGLDTRPVVARRSSRLPTSQFRRSGTPRGCRAAVGSGGFTPNQYLSAYGFDPLHSQGLTGQGERVAVMEIGGYRRSDIAGFARCFGMRTPPLITHRVGISKPLPADGEAMLDLEEVDAGAPGLVAIDVYEGGSSTAQILRALSAPLRNPGAKPQVISSSLGLCERETLEDLGRAGTGAFERTLQTAAASGVSFVVASGDDGSSDCTSEDDPYKYRLAVDYPGSSPWATSVGGTNLQMDAANRIVQQPVWNSEDGAGGGGVSHLFARPGYQDAVVSGPAREVPDVSMLSDTDPGYAIYCTARSFGCETGEDPEAWQGGSGGTSAAAPLLAGGIALADEVMRRNGRPDLGFLNPLLYRLGTAPAPPSVFDDVTRLGNDLGPRIRGIGHPLGCCAATAGYDDASGWGSVNITNLTYRALLQAPGSP